jgi:DNA-binding transcriptional MerR regulator
VLKQTQTQNQTTIANSVNPNDVIRRSAVMCAYGVTVEDVGIGAVAARLGIDADTLRWFERRGVVPPPGRDASGRRRYTDADVHVLEVLMHLRGTGMPLIKIAEFTAWVVADPDGAAERLTLLTEHREHVLVERGRLDASLAVIEQKIADYTARITEPSPHS